MELTQEMVYAAIREGVAQGVLPKTAQGEDDYLKIHEQVAAMLRAALAAGDQ